MLIILVRTHGVLDDPLREEMIRRYIMKSLITVSLLGLSCILVNQAALNLSMTAARSGAPSYIPATPHPRAQQTARR